VIRKTAAAVAAALLLGACGSVNAGVAARVGDHTIETSELADRVSRAFESEAFTQQGPERDEYQRGVLQSLINARLVAIAAERLGVQVTDEQVEAREKQIIAEQGGEQAYEQQLATNGIRREDVPTLLRNLVTEEAVLDKMVENEVTTEAQLRAEYRRALPRLDQARIAHILVRDKKTADRVVALAKAPGADFAALAKRHSQDNETREEGGVLGVLGNGEGRFAKEFERAVFAAEPGDVVGPIRTVTGGDAKIVGYEIVQVIERRTQTFDDVRDALRRSMLQPLRQKRFEDYMAGLAKEFDVKVNPRFGRWDAAKRAVAAPDGTVLSSPEPVPGGEAPPGNVVPPGPVTTAPPRQQQGATPPGTAPPAP
jgi:foldase protein PrsA